MTPKDEANHLMEENSSEAASCAALQQKLQQQRTVAFAFNYQLSLVDEFVGAPPPRRSRNGSTGGDLLGGGSKAAEFNSNNNNNEGQLASSSSNDEDVESERTRRSHRDKQGKREVSLARIRVRYDMQAVPFVERNPEFLVYFRKWWGRRINTSTMTTEHQRQQQQQQPPENSKTPNSSNRGNNSQDSCINPNRRPSRLSHNRAVDVLVPTTTTSTTIPRDVACDDGECDIARPIPFLNYSSVVWVPSKRSEWEDSISEMTALCATAATRLRMNRTKTTAPGHIKLSDQHRQPQPPAAAAAPLSRDYISDRVDIDDPLHGYQIRHVVGGWLQGFIMWTNFTTWTHFFRWDSLHPQSGIAAVPGDFVDRHGSLAQELELLPRTGDPLDSGIIFENIAEIGLVGGLGCGEYLLRMALDDIRSRKQYKYVVLQATDSSRPFYEKFGFIRVGAICRYHSNKRNNHNNNSNKKKKQPRIEHTQQQHQDQQLPDSRPRKEPVQPCPPQQLPTQDDTTPGTGEESITNTTTEPALAKDDIPPIVGYRHWTHANESDASLQMHGGPSYMMCLALYAGDEEEGADESDNNNTFHSSSQQQQQPPQSRQSFLDAMMSVAVPTKPLIEQRTCANGSTVLSKLMQRRPSSQQQSALLPSLPRSACSSPVVRKKEIRKSLNSEAAELSSVVQPETLLDDLPGGRATTTTHSTSRVNASSLAVRPTIPAAPPTTLTRKDSKQDPPMTSPNNDDGEEGIEPASKRRKISTTEISSSNHDNVLVATTEGSTWKSLFPPMDPSATHQVKEETALVKTSLNASIGSSCKSSPSSSVKKKVSSSSPYGVNNRGDRLYYSVRGIDGRFTRVAIPGSTMTTDPNNPAETRTTDPNNPAETTVTTTTIRKSRRTLASAKNLNSLSLSPAKFRPVPERHISKSSASSPSPASPSSARSATNRKRPLRKDKSSKNLNSNISSSSLSLSSNRKKSSSKAIDRSELRKQKVKAYPRARPHFYNRVVKPIKEGGDAGLRTTTTKRSQQEQYFFVLHYNEEKEELILVPMEARGTMMGKRQGRPRYVCCIGTTDENFKTDHARNYKVVNATMVMKTPLVAQEAWDIEDD